MRDDRERLLDIIDAIERIEKYASQGQGAFKKSELIQNWIVHHLQIIGEAVNHLSPEFCKNHSEAPWPKIIGMRNILVHNYFDIDLDVVWQTVSRDLPLLKEKISSLIKIL